MCLQVSVNVTVLVGLNENDMKNLANATAAYIESALYLTTRFNQDGFTLTPGPINVIVNPVPAHDSSKDSGLHVGVIAGVTVAVVCSVLALAGVGYLLWRRKSLPPPPEEGLPKSSRSGKKVRRVALLCSRGIFQGFYI
jgi:hypothetical protein